MSAAPTAAPSPKPPKKCAVCGSTDGLNRCSRCKLAVYCSKAHQRRDWPQHRPACRPAADPLTSLTDALLPSIRAIETMPVGGAPPPRPYPQIRFSDSYRGWRAPAPHLDTVCATVIQDLNSYGVCVVDNFMGEAQGANILNEVLQMHTKGIFKNGQLVSSRGDGTRAIRGDQITWIHGKEENCANIGYMIAQVDAVLMKANKTQNNGKLGQYNINGRTKAMVACYPGHGSHYVKHVDNPNQDGRCITAIYYLNKDWDVLNDGGLLRIFPEGPESCLADKVANIEPIFDRLLFFWSDRRNPHEVQPAFRTRYAITLWYFDSNERPESRYNYKEQFRNYFPS